MTCCAAITDGRTIWMAGDSRSTSPYGVNVQRYPKVFERAGVLFGVSGHVWCNQVLRHLVDVPPVGAAEPEAWLVREFTPALRDALNRRGLVGCNTDGGSRLWALLVGLKGELFRVYDDLSLEALTGHYAVLGSGADYACGALYATEGLPIEPTERLELALGAAAQHDAGVGRPFTHVAFTWA